MIVRHIAGAILAFQALSQPVPAFEVTSVRPAPADPRQRVGRFGCTEGEGFAAGSMAVTAAIRFAYQVEYFQILGGPSWVGTEPYEIVGKPASPVSEPQCRLMLQALLRDRFKLTLRRESKEIPVYALVVDKNGPKVKRVDASDTQVNGPGFTMNGRSMQMLDPKLTGWTMEQLAETLGVAGLGRPVVDKTGLEGIYKIVLDFHMRDTPGDGVDVTTAVREQLGLRLESSTAAFEMLSIDHVERPDPN
jgi:uncharacterized protein (TIGR03435 family)